MNQEEILSEIVNKIKDNTSALLKQNVPMDVIFTNLVGKGYKLYINKDVNLQNTVDLCALCLTVYLKLTQEKGK